MPPFLSWRLEVRLREGARAQIATIDFVRRETIVAQLPQLAGRQDGVHPRALYEFTNELGELLAFRASAYCSHAIIALEVLAGNP